MQPVEPDLKLDGFSLWVFGRQFPDANDYWDGNWLPLREGGRLARQPPSSQRAEATPSLVEKVRCARDLRLEVLPVSFSCHTAGLLACSKSGSALYSRSNAREHLIFSGMPCFSERRTLADIIGTAFIICSRDDPFVIRANNCH
jgi:hypothetical protein